MKNNNSHNQPGLRLPLLPAPPACGGPAPRGALPPHSPPPRRGYAGRTGSGRKGFSLCRGRTVGPPPPPRRGDSSGSRAGSSLPAGALLLHRTHGCWAPEGFGGPLGRPFPPRPRIGPAGPWGKRGGGEGRPRSPDGFLGPVSPGGEKKPTWNEAARGCSRPPGVPHLPSHPSAGWESLYPREIPGKRLFPPPPRALTPSSGLRCPSGGGREGAERRDRSCPGYVGQREPPDALESTAMLDPDPSPGAAVLPPPAARPRDLRAPSGGNPRSQRRPPPPPFFPELPLPSDCLDFSPVLKKIFPVIQISGK